MCNVSTNINFSNYCIRVSLEKFVLNNSYIENLIVNESNLLNPIFSISLHVIVVYRTVHILIRQHKSVYSVIYRLCRRYGLQECRMQEGSAF